MIKYNFTGDIKADVKSLLYLNNKVKIYDHVKAVAEVKEEIGLNVLPEDGECIFTITTEKAICDVWLFRQDFDICHVVLQENETTEAKYATKDEIRTMINSSEFIVDPYYNIDNLFDRTRTNV